MEQDTGAVTPTGASSYLTKSSIPSLSLFPVLIRDILFNSGGGARFPFLTCLEMIRLYLEALHLAATKQLAFVEGTIEQWLDTRHFSEDFQTRYLVPFLSGMGTCSKTQIFDYPASVILHMVSRWGDDTYQVVGGVRNVCSKLLEPVSEVVFNCEISGVWKDAATGKVVVQDSTGYKRLFDKIVFAGAAHTARRIIMATPPKDLAAVKPDKRFLSALSKFSFLPVRVVVHTDSSIMPRDKKHWRGINLAIDEKRDAMATLWINYMQNIAAPGTEFHF